MDKKESFWYRLGSGFVIGLGLVIPGVSGGVLAMVVGLYEPIIAAVANPLANMRDNIKLLLRWALAPPSACFFWPES